MTRTELLFFLWQIFRVIYLDSHFLFSFLYSSTGGEHGFVCRLLLFLLTLPSTKRDKLTTLNLPASCEEASCSNEPRLYDKNYFSPLRPAMLAMLVTGALWTHSEGCINSLMYDFECREDGRMLKKPFIYNLPVAQCVRKKHGHKFN